MAVTSQGSEPQAAPYKDVEVLVVYVVIYSLFCLDFEHFLYVIHIFKNLF